MEQTITQTEEAADNAVAAVKENAAQVEAAVEDTATAVADEAKEIVADAKDTVENVVAETEDAVATTEPACKLNFGAEGENGGACNMNTLLIGGAAVVVLTVIVALIFGAKKKSSGKDKGGNASGGKSDVVEIYVGNLSYDMNDAQLRKEFERFGVVKSARVITHRTNAKSKGYGFVEMPHRKEAGYAIKALNDSEVMGRRIRVNEARANTRPA